MTDFDPQARPDLSRTPPPASPPPVGGTGTDIGTGFDFNRPTIIALLYLSAVFLGVTALVGVVLAYVWKDEAGAEWEASHYEYLIRTFWIGLVGSVISIVLMLLLIGFVLIAAVGVLVTVRCVLSLINAQKRAPMPNPRTLLA